MTPGLSHSVETTLQTCHDEGMKRLRVLPAMILALSVGSACVQPAPTPGPVVTETVTASESSGSTETTRHAPSPTTATEIDTGTEAFARERARELIGYEIYSATGLEFALIEEGFSRQDARRAVDSLDVDWNEQAVAAVNELKMFTMHSRVGMLRDLKSGGFTQAEAEYAIEHTNVDYYENALQMAYFLDGLEGGMLFEDIRQQLIDDHGFLPEEANWAIDNLYPDAMG